MAARIARGHGVPLWRLVAWGAQWAQLIGNKIAAMLHCGAVMLRYG